jgi:hypothetical protein
MEYSGKLPVIAPLCIAGLLSACAAPSHSVITRAWQVDHTLAGVDRDCRFNAISRTVTEEISARIDADQVFEELSQACPELMLAGTANASGERIFITDGEGLVATSLGAAGFGSSSERSTGSDRSSNDSRADAGDSTGSAGGGAGGSSRGDTGGNAGSSDGGDASGDTGGGTGGDKGGGTGGDSTSDTSGKGGRNGSNANNGGGNGSEGASPGRGKGAHQDE